MSENGKEVAERLVKQKKSFAFWREPNTKKIHFVTSRDGQVETLSKVLDLNTKEGFIFAPFSPQSKCPILCLSIDIKKTFSLADFPAVRTYAHAFPADKERTQARRALYANDFTCFMDALRQGELEKVVLARKQECPLPSSFSAMDTFVRALHVYPSSYVYFFYSPLIGVWIGSTPETLLAGKANQWRTMALAGTLRVEGEKAPLWDVKNTKEQGIVADYIAKSLSRFGALALQRQKTETVRAGALFHLRSLFHFVLPPDRGVGDLLALLHPTPAVSGFPKEEAIRFILAKEALDRTYYAGFVGLLQSQEDASLYVNLRCLNVGKKTLTLYAGGGLLAESDEESEWLETEYKLQTMKTIV